MSACVLGYSIDGSHTHIDRRYCTLRRVRHRYSIYIQTHRHNTLQIGHYTHTHTHKHIIQTTHTTDLVIQQYATLQRTDEKSIGCFVLFRKTHLHHLVSRIKAMFNSIILCCIYCNICDIFKYVIVYVNVKMPR